MIIFLRIAIIIVFLLSGLNYFAQLDVKHFIPPVFGREDFGCHYAVISTPSITPFNVTITDGTGTPINTVAVSAAASVSVPIACGSGSQFLVTEAELNSIKTDKGLILEAPEAFYVNFRVFANPQAMSLTSKGRNAALGTDFRTGHMFNHSGNDWRKSNVFGIMATEDNTTINISDISAGVIFRGTIPVGTPLTSPDVLIVLDAGETYVMAAFLDEAAATNNVNGVNGTHITSDKPICVNSGTWLGGNAIVGGSQAAGRDIGIDQIVPIDKIGNEYVLIKGEGIDNEKTMVIGTVNGTDLFLDGSAVATATINAGDYYVIDGTSFSANDNLYLQSSEDVFVYQMANGGDGLTDDNERQCGLNFLPPVGCSGSKDVRLPNVDSIGTALINIIANTGSNVYVNGILQGPGDAVVGTSDYVTYKLAAGYTGDVQVSSDDLARVALINLSGNIGAAGYFSGFTKDITVQTETVNSDGIALEGCIPASFTFSIADPSATDTDISYWVMGSATNGVDYQFIDTLLTIPAGQTSASVIINSIQDGITEGQETIYIIYQPDACSPIDTAVLLIDDAQPIEFDLNGIDLLCHEDSTGVITVNAVGGFPPYTYEVTDSSGNVNNYTVSPIGNQAAGEYTVQVYDFYGCKADALVIGGAFDAGQTFLPDGSGVTYTSDIVIAGFDTGATLDTISQLQQICASLEHSYLGDLSIRIIAPSGESVLLKDFPGGGSCDLGEPIATGPVDGGASSTLTDPGVGYDYCWNESPTWGTMVAESNTWVRNYTDSQGHNYTDNYLIAGSYASFEPLDQLLGAELNGIWTLEVTDNYGLDNGYIFEWNISLLSDLPDTTVVIEEPEGLNIGGFITQATCGGSDGEINVDVIGEHGPFTYLWSNGATTEDLVGISGGTYTIWVTDTTSCVDSATFLLNNISSINISSILSDATCAGGADASIDISISGGTPSYAISWAHGPTTEDITGLMAGTYTASITDADGCVYSEDITVGEMPLIVVDLEALVNEVCGTGNGSIQVSASGGTGSYGFSWSSGEFTDDIFGLSGGAYDLTVTDGNGCSIDENFTVLNDVSACSGFCYLDITNITALSDTCLSGLGSIDITVTDPVNPYNVSWSHGPSIEDLTGLVSGTYTVYVNDAQGCEDSATIVVPNSSGTFEVSSIHVIDETCGDGSGSIDLSVTGGSLLYSYTWSNAESTEDIDALSSGTYTVIITDATGCSISDTAIINNNTGTLVETGSVVNDTCNAGIGEIDLNIVGGNLPLTISWDSGQTTQDLSNLNAGDYTCTITDFSGCVLVTNVYTVLNTSGSLSLDNITINNEQCSNALGSIDLEVSGGSIIDFLWNTGAVTEDLSGLSAGVYNCVIIDANGCETSTGALDLFNAPSSLSVSTNFVTDEICSNGSGAINIDVSGGTTPFTYSWSSGSISQDLLNAPAGTYTVTVSDSVGCVTAHSEIINNIPGTLNIDNAIVIDENCGDGNGSIDLILSGGSLPYTILWSNASTSEDLSGLIAGTYIVEVSDNTGCQVSGSYEVNNSTTSLAVTPTITSEICSNGSGSILLDITGSGGYTFLWNTGETSQDIVGLSAGNYSCTITDGSGCSVTTGNLEVVNNPGSLIISALIVDDTCSAGIGSFDITVTGANGAPSFLWSTLETTEDISGLTAGLYDVTVSDTAGCTSFSSFNLTDIPGTLSVDSIIVSNELCGNGLGEINLVVTGGSAPVLFSWSNGAITEDIAGLAQGNYSCDISDNNGCFLSTGMVVLSNDPGTLSLDNVIVFDEQCGNSLGSLNVSVSGGLPPYNFLWNTGATTEDLNSLTSGIYTCTVTDQNGCELPISTSVGNNAGALAVSASVVSDEACGNGMGSINITVVGGAAPIDFSWSNGSTSEDLTGLSAGSYSVQITDGNGCTISHTEEINNAGGSLAISGATVSDEICGNAQGSIDITITGGTAPLTFDWSNGAISEDVDGLISGNYDLLVTDFNGCTVSQTFLINSNTGSLSIDSVSFMDESCGNEGGSIDLHVSGGNAPITYLWTSGETTEDLAGLVAGTYSVDVLDNFGCMVSTSITIVNNTGGFMAEITSVTDENCGDSTGAIDLTVTGGFAPYDFIWSDGSVTEDLSGLAAGSFAVTVGDGAGCSLILDTLISNVTTGLVLSSANIQNENCGDGTGFIDLTLVGGSLPYAFLWSNGATTEDISGLSSGVYTCQITDLSGCVLNYSGDVVNTGGSLVITEVIQDELCDNSDGSITVTVVGGISPYTFTWSGGGSGNCCDYTIDMTDSFGDGWNGASIDVEINGVLTSNHTIPGGGSANTETFEVCNGDNVELFWNSGAWDEEVGFTLSDPAGTVIFTQGIDPPVGSLHSFVSACPGTGTNVSSINGLDAGSYDLTITDDVGCSYSQTYVVDSSWNYLLDFSTITAVDANCGIGGDLSVTATGGTFYTYYLDGNSTTFPNWFGIGAGVFNVVIEDENGCTVEQDITINDILPFELSFSNVTDEDCGLSNGAVDVTVSPSGAYSYLWNTGASTEDLSGIMAGYYSLTVSDGSGCTGTIDTTIITDPGFTIALVATDESCGDSSGMIDLTVSLPDVYAFSWSNGSISEDITGLTAGNYEVIATNSLGCSAVGLIDILNVTTGIMITGSITTNEICQDSTGAIDLSISGGSIPYVFSWSNGETTEDLTSLTSGLYTCTVTDQTGCALNYSGSIISDDSFSITSSVEHELCNDDNGSVFVAVSGGLSPYSFSWDGAGSGQTCCDYTLDMFDASTSWNGATVEVVIDGVSIGTFTVFGGGANMETFEVCDGENVELIWSAGAFDGEVSFNLLDASGAIIFMQGPNPPVGPLFSFTGACPASANTSISGLTAGSYELEITDGTGCTRTEIFEVDSTYNSLLAFSSISIEDDHCATGVGEIDVVAIGSSTFSYYLDGVLQSGTPLNGLFTGTYTVTVEDADGCSIETIETIGNTLTFSSIYVNVSDENCSGNDGIIDIYVSPPSSSYTYSWSNGATTQDLFGVVAGTYSVTIDDGSGCIGTMDTTINDSFSFSSSYTATHEFCSDGTGSIDLSVAGGSGPFDYSWNTGDTTEDISGLSANTYVATVTNLDDGCIDSITVVINDTIGFTITDVIQSDSCGFGNGSIDLNLSGSVGPFTFTWSNGESTEDITGLTAGNYSVEIIDQGTGCTKTMDYVVLSSSSYGLVGSVADASCPTCADGAISISLTGSPTGPFEVLWSNGDTVFNIDSLLPGWYTLNVEDALGCMVVDSFEINAPTLIVENNSWNVLIYPNPTSEVFKVNYQVSGAKELNFEIFDIVGQLIKTRRSGSNEGVVRFDLNGERSGTYYLRISSSNSSKTYRLMLIR